MGKRESSSHCMHAVQAGRRRALFLSGSDEWMIPMGRRPAGTRCMRQKPQRASSPFAQPFRSRSGRQSSKIGEKARRAEMSVGKARKLPSQLMQPASARKFMSQ